MVETIQKNSIEQTSTLSFTPTGLGVVVCQAENAEGKSEVRANVIVNDSNEDFDISTKNELPIVIGDDVSITCGASAFKYAGIDWYQDHVLVKDTMSMFHSPYEKNELNQHNIFISRCSSDIQ